MIEYGVLKDLSGIKTSDKGDTLLTDLLNSFEKQTPLRLYQLKDAIQQNNIDLILRISHLIRGSCCYLGVNNLAYQCQEFEKWGQQQKSKTIAEAFVYFNAIEKSFEDSINELKEYINTEIKNSEKSNKGRAHVSQ